VGAQLVVVIVVETLDIAVETEIPGVKPAEQARSRRLQDHFVTAGQKLLCEMPLAEFSIPELAKEAGSSVGGFYSRFENKEVFFSFLRARMLAENNAIFAGSLNAEALDAADIDEISHVFIDVMIQVYSGSWRGVLREAYARIPKKQGAWAPMRSRGGELAEVMTSLLRPKLLYGKKTEELIRFAIQMVFSVLNSELMNRHLPFSIKDEAFRRNLIAMFAGFLMSSEKAHPAP